MPGTIAPGLTARSVAFQTYPDLSRPSRAQSSQELELTGEPFRWLRPAQRAALSLVEFTSSFLCRSLVFMIGMDGGFICERELIAGEQ